MDDLTAFNEVYGRFFTSSPLPARTTVQVSRLASPDYLVEVDAVAALVD
jgi:enamine deaminase RidA (YjgF/YER057c/UK114 family)